MGFWSSISWSYVSRTYAYHTIWLLLMLLGYRSELMDWNEIHHVWIEFLEILTFGWFKSFFNWLTLNWINLYCAQLWPSSLLRSSHSNPQMQQPLLPYGYFVVLHKWCYPIAKPLLLGAIYSAVNVNHCKRMEQCLSSASWFGVDSPAPFSWKCAENDNQQFEFRLLSHPIALDHFILTMIVRGVVISVLILEMFWWEHRWQDSCFGSLGC